MCKYIYLANIQMIFTVFTEHLLYLRHYSRHLRYINETERERGKPLSMWKHTTNIVKLHGMLDGDKCYGKTTEQDKVVQGCQCLCWWGVGRSE